MQNFIYHNPVKIIFGKGTIKQIGKEIQANGINRVLLLAGGGSIKENGVYDATVKSLIANGIEWVEHWGVHPNPELPHAEKGIEIVKNNKLQAILAVGGGSTIDEAKSISIGCFTEDLWSAYEGKSIPSGTLPIFTILTISATGSEMNPTAVLSNPAINQKLATRHQGLYPKASIIDPTVQMSLPWRQTVNGGIDAMSHVMEQYFPGSKQEVTLAFNEMLMRTIIDCLNRLQKDESDYEARSSLAWTATLALNGLPCVGIGPGDWAVHRIEHGISGIFPEIAHGSGLAVVHPAWIRYVHTENPEIFERWAKNVWDMTDISSGIDRMITVFKGWGAPVSLKELGIENNQIPKIVDNILYTGDPGLIKRLDKQDLTQILNLASI
jgi:alcohol dehydrogenase YqhD (iron-dependent ADH family)